VVDEPFDSPVPIPLDGRLDLHLFHPRDVPALLEAYLPECRAAGVLQLEIVHGKGTGALSRRVRALLAGREDVAEVRTADEARGGWGVTLVRLHPMARGGDDPVGGTSGSQSGTGGV
jgi:DNA-nicking Smr family endonuclease